MKVVLKSNRHQHYATGDYENNTITVFKGSQINTDITYGKMPKRIIALRNDRRLVSETGIVLVDLVFNSPSEAAQFITGRSVNGYIAWRIDDKISLKEYRNKTN